MPNSDSLVLSGLLPFLQISSLLVGRKARYLLL
jgi:hypothetical protein